MITNHTETNEGIEINSILNTKGEIQCVENGKSEPKLKQISKIPSISQVYS